MKVALRPLPLVVLGNLVTSVDYLTGVPRQLSTSAYL